MKIDQIYYTRLDEGWGIAKVTEGITEKFKNAFQSVNAQNPADKTILSFDTFDGGYALSKSVPAGMDSFGRAKFFVHGYLFSELDSDEIFNNYSGLLNIKEFAESAEQEIIPLHSLPADHIQSMQLGSDKLRNLLNCTYEAVLQRKKLEIKISENNKEEFLRAIMNVIYEYLPLYLRKFVSYSSSIGGVSRTITLTGEFSGNADIMYDYEANITTGNLSKSYVDIVETVIENRAETLSKIEKYISNAFSTEFLDESTYRKAFDYVMFGTNKVSDDGDTVSKLMDMLLEKKYNDASSAAYMSALIDTCVKNNADISNSMHGMIMDAYFSTHQTELKESIEKYIVYSYEKKCSDVDFEKLNELQNENPGLHRMIYNKGITEGASDLIKHISSDVVNNSAASDYIVEKCEPGCRDIIADSIADLIVGSKDKNLVDKIVERSMHKYVMESVIIRNPDKSIVWEYIHCIFNNKLYFETFKSLKADVSRDVLLFLVNEIDENKVDVLYAVRQTARDVYEYIEQELAERSKYKIIEDFYTQYLLRECISTNDVQMLCEKIARLIPSVSRFAKIALEKYFSLSQRKCINRNATLNEINGLDNVGKKMGLSVNDYTSQLKNEFWKNFKFTEWETDEDYSELYVSNNKKSSVIEVMSRLAASLDSSANNIDREMKDTAVFILMDDASPLDETTRDLYINALKKKINHTDSYSSYGRKKRNSYRAKSYYGNADETDVEVVLLLNYSNKKRSLDENIRLENLSALKDYIKRCIGSHAKNVIDYPDLLLSLYEIVFDRKSESKQRRSEYGDVLRALDTYVDRMTGKEKRYVLKEIKKITEYPDYSWISFGAVLLVFTFAFICVDTFALNGFIRMIIKILLVIAGIFAAISDAVCDVKDHGNAVVFVSQILSGIAMFVTFLFTVTTLV